MGSHLFCRGTISKLVPYIFQFMTIRLPIICFHPFLGKIVNIFIHMYIINYCFINFNKSARRKVNPSQIIPNCFILCYLTYTQKTKLREKNACIYYSVATLAVGSFVIIRLITLHKILYKTYKLNRHFNICLKAIRSW
jgi:hypothetical protein